LQACRNEQTGTVKEHLTATFRRYGLPERMLMDNGSPWGNDREHQYTPLTVWLLLLGVGVSHGRPYHPQTQGKDERFHRSLKVQVLAQRIFGDFEPMQIRFNEWRYCYNHVRPHESFGHERAGEPISSQPTISVAQSKVAFEIHLPQLIWSFMLKPLVAAGHAVRQLSHAPISLQDRMRGTPGQRRLFIPLQAPFDLPRTPAILVSNRQHLLLHRWIGPAWRMPRSPRSISQSRGAALLVSLQPFVSSLSTDSKSLTKLAEIASWLARQKQKLLSQVHGGTLLPRHVFPPKKVFMPLSIVLPMSSDTCYPCLRSVQIGGWWVLNPWRPGVDRCLVHLQPWW